MVCWREPLLCRKWRFARLINGQIKLKMSRRLAENNEHNGARSDPDATGRPDYQGAAFRYVLIRGTWAVDGVGCMPQSCPI
ncbi:hypothetical protein BGLA2_1080065 [Burkholderia gladioli]|nr:hypothetical protein BGLA2_1080065 [Burkholderia gladioli]